MGRETKDFGATPTLRASRALIAISDKASLKLAN